MEIPLWIMLIPLGIIMACTALFLFFNIFHLARYGIEGRGAIALILVYIVSYAFVLVLGLGMLGQVDWIQTVKLSSIFPMFSSLSGSSIGL